MAADVAQPIAPDNTSLLYYKNLRAQNYKYVLIWSVKPHLMLRAYYLKSVTGITAPSVP